VFNFIALKLLKRKYVPFLLVPCEAGYINTTRNLFGVKRFYAPTYKFCLYNKFVLILSSVVIYMMSLIEFKKRVGYIQISKGPSKCVVAKQLLRIHRSLCRLAVTLRNISRVSLCCAVFPLKYFVLLPFVASKCSWAFRSVYYINTFYDSACIFYTMNNKCYVLYTI